MIDLNELDGLNSMEEIQKKLAELVEAHNKSGRKDFEGLSPEKMHALFENFPGEGSPLVMNRLSEKELENSPLLMQIRFLIDKMKGGKELKLTKTGALSTKLVKEVYGLGYLKDEWIEKGISKLYREAEVVEVSITRILLQISSLVKKRNGKLSLTKKGEKHADDGNFILKEILMVLIRKFNWAYFDGYQSEMIGKVNAEFSLYLLKKYGDKKRFAKFYAEKYFKAFPSLMGERGESKRCYELRTFDRYFYYMGFVNKEEKDFLDPTELKKTAFFDKLFSIKQ